MDTIIFEKSRYREYDPQSCETYDSGPGFRCPKCFNVWKVDHVTWRWGYCPGCGNKIKRDDDGKIIIVKDN